MTRDIEALRNTIQERLDKRKTAKERNKLGQFATPSALAESVLTYAGGLVPESKAIRFLDPALGTGSFYSALVRVFGFERIGSAKGFEIDPHYALPALELWKNWGIEVKLADFTAVRAPEGNELANLVICNPPYVRHHHMDANTKARLGEAAARASGVAFGGLSGLYCYFMAIAHGWLSEGAIAGWLIPSEFMDVNYGSALRRYLTDVVELIHIHRYDPTELQFDDAQVSSCVVWFRKRQPQSSSTVQMSFGGSLSRPQESREVSLDELRLSSKWSGLARGAVVKSRYFCRL